MDKAELRQLLSSRLRAMSDESQRARGAQICQRAIDSIDWVKVRSIACYQPQAALFEVDIEALARYARFHHPHIRVDFVSAHPSAEQPDFQYDLIIVPLLGFDETNNRLGRGGGWYDRFLSSQTHALKIGVGYSIQKVASIPTEPHDIALDKIIEA